MIINKTLIYLKYIMTLTIQNEFEIDHIISISIGGN